MGPFNGEDGNINLCYPISNAGTYISSYRDHMVKPNALSLTQIQDTGQGQYVFSRLQM